MSNSTRILINPLLILFIPFFVLCSRPLQGEEHYQKEYNFTHDWFTRHIPSWENILLEFKGKPHIHYLEIGVFEGRSFLWTLENVLTHRTSTATAIDPLDPLPNNRNIEEVLFSNLAMSGVQDKTEIIKGYSQVELGKLPAKSFDIIYIDGDHNASSVLVDIVLSWPLLKKGGLLIFDDYKMKIEELPPERRPKIAIDAFLAAYKDYIDVVHIEYWCAVRKKSYFYWENL